MAGRTGRQTRRGRVRHALCDVVGPETDLDNRKGVTTRRKARAVSPVDHFRTTAGALTGALVAARPKEYSRAYIM